MLTPDRQYKWIISKNDQEFKALLPIGNKATKRSKNVVEGALFKTYSIGVNTNRDAWAYNFDRESLRNNMKKCIETYNSEIDRWKRARKPKEIDSFVLKDESQIKWSSRLKETFAREHYAEFEEKKIRNALYRPFTKKFLFFDAVINHRQAVFPKIFPTPATEQENKVIVIGGYGRKDFAVFAGHTLTDLNFYADPAQCFPLYIYDENGDHRRENITDWAMDQFRTHYHDQRLTKWDIFLYLYGILHHPGYRVYFAENLKYDFPGIPLAENFRAFRWVGEQLLRLHLHYEDLDPYPLHWVESAAVPLSYTVEKMRLSSDKNAIKVNDSLTLRNIPPEVFHYRLGNRSALEWVIDQYQVKQDQRSRIRSNPNREDDGEYIVRLVGQVVHVSLETFTIVQGLPTDFLAYPSDFFPLGSSNLTPQISN